MPDPSDAQLVRAAQDDPAEFAAVYERHMTPVYRYCLARLGNVQDAEDATASVFEAALDGLDDYTERGHFAAWLFTIARRQVTRRWTLASRERARDTTDAIPVPTHKEVEKRDLVERCLASLNEERREALILRFYGGLRVTEVAGVMGKGESATKMLIHRGLLQLRDLLSESEDA